MLLIGIDWDCPEQTRMKGHCSYSHLPSNLSAVIRLKEHLCRVTFSKLQFPLLGHISNDGGREWGVKSTRQISFNFKKKNQAKRKKDQGK